MHSQVWHERGQLVRGPQGCSLHVRLRGGVRPGNRQDGAVKPRACESEGTGLPEDGGRRGRGGRAPAPGRAAEEKPYIPSAGCAPPRGLLCFVSPHPLPREAARRKPNVRSGVMGWTLGVRKCAHGTTDSSVPSVAHCDPPVTECPGRPGACGFL